MITSKDNEIIKNVSKLVKSSKHRKTVRQFTAEGVRLCCDGVRSGYRPAVFLYTSEAKEKYNDAFIEISAVSDTIFEVSKSIFERLSDTKSPQGFFCVFKILDKIEKLYRINNQGTYIGLENIQDPSNLGTILRTAEALGVDGVILSGDCCDIYSPKVVRGSMGAVFRIPFTVQNDFCGYIEELVSKGILVYASTPYDAEDITNIDFSGGVMLIGNEGAGLTQDVLSICTLKVKIPMKGRAESLNAAAAAGILMWEMLR